MKDFSQDNISKRLIDIKGPKKNHALKSVEGEPEGRKTPGDPTQILEEEALTPQSTPDFISLPARATHPTKFIIAFLLLSFFLFGGGWIFRNTISPRGEILNSAAKSFEEFESALENLTFFNSGVPKESSTLPHENLNQADILTLLKDGGQTLGNLQNVTSRLVLLGREVEVFKNDLPALIFGRRGKELIDRLEKIKGALTALNNETSQLASVFSRLKSILPTDISAYLPFHLDLQRLQNFFESLIAWLHSPSPRELLLFFQNPSEMRPGGGFIGSYAQVTLEGGAIAKLEIHDINDPDRELKEKIVPPKPLQAITTRWRAADANWFFDFSDSAAKVIELLETSEMYKKNSVTFDGAIGVSDRVIRDILAFTGPIKMPGYDLTISKDNFLIEIQKQVEKTRSSGRDNPKDVIQELGILLLEAASSKISTIAKKDYAPPQSWLIKKDVVVHLREPALQKFIDYYNWAGRTTSLSPDFNGDYLAVVNANIGGGKTDIFIDENVTLESHVNASGTVTNSLTIQRAHEGGKSSDPWHRVANENYLKIFTPLGVKLTGAEGNREKRILPPLDYEKKGYKIDPLVSEIEATKRDYVSFPGVESFQESGKNVFGAWSKVKRGETTKLVFEYERKLLIPPEAGKSYQFIFEKQSGSRGSYKFEINAPIGFVWKENRLPVFGYETTDPDRTLILNLTLVKI